jgi:hypothetical protein
MLAAVGPKVEVAMKTYPAPAARAAVELPPEAGGSGKIVLEGGA